MVLERLRAAAKNPKPLLEAVGLYMVGQVQGTFRLQGRPGLGAWTPRSVPNRMGILMDLLEGRTPPARRWDPTPAGVDTGRLKGSIAYRITGNLEVTVGSPLPYASDVQRGATKTVTVDGGLRSALAGWLRGLSGEEKKRGRAAMGFLFHTGSLTVTTPPRPFAGVTDENRRRIREMAGAFFLGVARGGQG